MKPHMSANFPSSSVATRFLSCVSAYLSPSPAACAVANAIGEVAAAEESAAAATGAAEAKASGLAKYSLAWGGERKRDEQVSLCYERAMIAMLYPSPHLFLLLL